MREKLEDQMELNEKYEDDAMSIAVSLKFQGNSGLLAGFYDAIESKLIK